MNLLAGRSTVFACLLLTISSPTDSRSETMERVRVSDDGTSFVLAESGRLFSPWGVNYDRDDPGRLLEDYWEEEWKTVAEDFREMKELGANVVRIHLQFGKFMESAEQPDEGALSRLGKLLDLAGASGLRLDITGLACYHRDEVPEWYDALDEEGRWAAQARFWEAVARVCQGRPEVFCYDLMNEPVVPGKPAESWLPGDGFGGKFFVQNITRDPGDRDRREIAAAWVNALVDAIRRHDPDTLVTVGVIPWVFAFEGKGKPLFYSPEVSGRLDFASVHFYPRKGKLDLALSSLEAYDIGKPLVVEETFPLHCTAEELEEFISRGSEDGLVDGWISFYWGRTADDYEADPGEKPMQSAMVAAWLRRFEAIGKKR